MKNARGIEMRSSVGRALGLALCALAAAPAAGQGLVKRASLRGTAGTLELSLRLEAGEHIQPRALIPLADDLNKIVTLSGGAPGSFAQIEVGLSSPGRQAFSNVAVFRGTFGRSGEFVVEFPPELDLRSCCVRGAQSPGRMVTALVSLEDAVEEAFVTWQRLGELARPRAAGTPGGQASQSGHVGHAPALDPRLRSRTYVEGVVIVCPADLSGIRTEVVGQLANPERAGTPGGQAQASGAGHVSEGPTLRGMGTRTIDLGDSQDEGGLSISWDNLGTVARPERAGTPGDQEYPRRRRPGHVR